MSGLSLSILRVLSPVLTRVRPPQVHVDRTLRLALLLGAAAVQAKVGAYVRLLPSFSKLKSDSEIKKGLKVGSDGAGDAEPWGTLSKWHHEAARGLAKLEGYALCTSQLSLRKLR